MGWRLGICLVLFGILIEELFAAEIKSREIALSRTKRASRGYGGRNRADDYYPYDDYSEYGSEQYGDGYAVKDYGANYFQDYYGFGGHESDYDNPDYGSRGLRNYARSGRSRFRSRRKKSRGGFRKRRRGYGKSGGHEGFFEASKGSNGYDMDDGYGSSGGYGYKPKKKKKFFKPKVVIVRKIVPLSTTTMPAGR